jgi:hypothetical protein
VVPAAAHVHRIYVDSASGGCSTQALGALSALDALRCIECVDCLMVGHPLID